MAIPQLGSDEVPTGLAAAMDALATVTLSEHATGADAVLGHAPPPPPPPPEVVDAGGSGADAAPGSGCYEARGALSQCLYGMAVAAGADVAPRYAGQDVILVADSDHDRICVFDVAGQCPMRAWGGTGSGSGAFRTPIGVAVAPVGGPVWVVDFLNHRFTSFD